MGLERKPSEQGPCRAHQAASSSSWCMELILPAPSLQHSPLSRVAHGAVYGGKAWQMQESSAKSLDAFSPQHCQQWHLVAWPAPHGGWGGPGLNSVRVWWVSLSLNSHQKRSLPIHPFILKGEEDKDRILSKHTPHTLSVLCPAPHLAQRSLRRPVLSWDSLAPAFPN